MTLAQGHNTSFDLEQQFCEILFQLMHSVKTYGPDKVNTTVHCDLDIWPVTLAQGHDTSLVLGQQICEILLKYLHSLEIYGLDNVKTTMCIVTLTFT